MILRLGVIDPMLMVGENGGSVVLALLEVILEKHGKPGGQEESSSKLEWERSIRKYILGLVSLEKKRSLDGLRLTNVHVN